VDRRIQRYRNSFDRMVGHGVLAALAAALLAAGCSDQQASGCAGTAVLITLTPSPAGAVTDGGVDADARTDGGGGDAKPACTGECDEYLEALRVAIEAATPAACVRRRFKTVLACVPSSTSALACPIDTIDAGVALEAQIRDYLGASWPEIETAAVSLDTCVCHAN
jgi:hypothetical protein